MAETKTSKWRTSASVIIVSRDSSKPATTCDYNLLMLKRSDQTAHYPNQTVFPGGILDKAGDETVAWLQYFDEFGVSQESLRSLVLIGDESRASIFAPQGTGCYDRFFKRSSIWAREITLRLTAVRECFEEVGVLLCRTRAQLDAVENAGQAHFKEDFDRQMWQQRVHNKPSEFLALCRQLEVVPDLWSLLEWSAWASPAALKRGYETAFFMVFVDTPPSLLAEESEVKECLWRTPAELLNLVLLGDLMFMPPQLYDVSRLLAIGSYESLLRFARQRSKLGTTLFMPVAYLCSDSVVNVLPGDDFYLPEPHLVSEFIPFDGTTAEFEARAKNLHRSKDYGVFKMNISPPNGHLPPQMLSADRHKL